MNLAPSSMRRGFTLIELLVVIAIIGILSAVVLASLNTARNKGGDAAVQSDLDGIRTQAEVYYNNLGANTYGTGTGATCGGTSLFTDSSIVNAIANITQSGGSAPVCGWSATAYAISAAQKSAGKYWCVDSTGVSKSTTANITAGATNC